MSEAERPQPDREGFGEASLGEAQAENPPEDPEMIRGGDEEDAEESAADQDAGPSASPEQAEQEPERDQAEG